MLNINYIRENTEGVKERLRIKNFQGEGIIDRILELDIVRREAQKDLDDTLAEANRLAKEIGNLFKQGKKDEAEEMRTRSTELKAGSKVLSDEMDKAAAEMNELLLQVPNLPHASVPAGRSADDNEIVREWGEIPELPEDAKAHWDIVTEYGIIDFELGAKITGAGFPVYIGPAARLQRALISFFLDRAAKAGYIEIQPPYLINADSGHGTGQLPDKDGQMYFMGEDNLYLIPTAEVPVTNIYRNVILREEELPVKNTAYSACFRREAGSYGKDVRGLNRLHQFDKVEIVQIVKPEDSYQILEQMLSHASGLLEELGLPYRILRLCGGDTSFTAALTYDLEVWSAAQKRWLEVSSVSNFEDYQANRMKCRFKDKTGKTRMVHTLNGSALALPRIVAAIIENFQGPEGILVPEVLRPFGIEEIIKPMK